jgi:hypothetical protein
LRKVIELILPFAGITLTRFYGFDLSQLLAPRETLHVVAAKIAKFCLIIISFVR